MSISRRCRDGTTHPEETLNKSQIYIREKGEIMKYYVYRIENLINHKNYIGITNNITRRKNRKLSKEQVMLILCNYEYHLFSIKEMTAKVGLKSTNSLYSIKKGLTYKEYLKQYDSLSSQEKENLVSLLRNQ